MSPARLLDYWSAPDGAGPPVACLASTFTFEADFFAQDCLSRFLNLSTSVGEGDRISSVVALLEEEDRLSETRVTVLVDRSSRSDRRNLRWDVLPVAAPGGLFHAKVAVLLWGRHGRVLVGSANLTTAGYRRQVEIVVPIDLTPGGPAPRPFLDLLVAELRRMVELAPGPADAGPRQRAAETLDLLAERVAAVTQGAKRDSGLRLALAPGRPGLSPLARLADVWKGPAPLRASVLSPFWDDQVPSPALGAVRALLTGRPAARRRLTAVVASDPYTGRRQAPDSLARQAGLHLVGFEPPDEKERRPLHGKLVVVESDEWVAALVGSSNATALGYGLGPRGHAEINVWIGCDAGSPSGKHLRALLRCGAPLAVDEEDWAAVPDEDEPNVPVLPAGFLACLLVPAPAGQAAMVKLSFDPEHLPEAWEVRDPSGTLLLDRAAWRQAGSRREVTARLPDGPLPSFLEVHWTEASGSYRATWVGNVEDRAALPPPDELAKLPVHLVLAALASTRPLPLALEDELRRSERTKQEGVVDLDPLRRFDDSGLLLQRARHLSLALWRLQERLSRPATNMDALEWRLRGAFGPLAIADGLVAAAADDKTLPGEAHFLLAELALTVAAVDWKAAAGNLGSQAVVRLVNEVLSELEARRASLPPAPDPSLDRYARDALAEARR
jgi:hypothetical protein